MDRISELRLILGGFLHWNKSRLDCFARMILALLTVQTANLRRVATAFIGEAEVDSHYKRIKRFFAQFQIDHKVIARWIFQLFFSSEKKFILQSIAPIGSVEKPKSTFCCKIFLVRMFSNED